MDAPLAKIVDDAEVLLTFFEFPGRTLVERPAPAVIDEVAPGKAAAPDKAVAA